MDLQLVQEELHKESLDGWLFIDFGGRDKIAIDLLGLDNKKITRRWAYFIPKEGNPIKLVHSLEPELLDHLKGDKKIYLGWEQFQAELEIIIGKKRIAMQYSPHNDVPTVSYVDAGFMDLVRDFGCKVVSSADLIQVLQTTLSDEQIELYRKARSILHDIKDRAFDLIFKSVEEGNTLSEFDVQEFISQEFEKNNIDNGDHEPIIAINEHANAPHYFPPKEGSAVFKKGDRVLIDLWGKINHEEGIYYDITWCGCVGTPSDAYRELFDVIVRARDAATNLIRERYAKKEPVYGFEVDDACRNVIRFAKMHQYVKHRTGHSIYKEVHAAGAGIDSLEHKENRKILPRTCFSIEPGLYTEDMGVRTEISVLITPDGEVEVVDEQKEILTPNA